MYNKGKRKTIIAEAVHISAKVTRASPTNVLNAYVTAMSNRKAKAIPDTVMSCAA